MLPLRFVVYIVVYITCAAQWKVIQQNYYFCPTNIHLHPLQRKVNFSFIHLQCYLLFSGKEYPFITQIHLLVLVFAWGRDLLEMQNTKMFLHLWKQYCRKSVIYLILSLLNVNIVTILVLREDCVSLSAYTFIFLGIAINHVDGEDNFEANIFSLSCCIGELKDSRYLIIRYYAHRITGLEKDAPANCLF